MNSENRPAGSGNNKNHKSKRKPYYMKKKEQDNRPAAEGEQVERRQAPEQAQTEQAPKQANQPERRKNENNERKNENRGSGDGKKYHNDRHGRGGRDHRPRQNDRKREDDAEKLAKTEAAAERETEIAEPETEETTVTETYTVVVEPEIFSPDTEEAAESLSLPEKEPENQVTVTGIRFKAGGKIYYFDKGDLELKNGGYVIVETARGLEFGEVAFATRQIGESHVVLPLRPVVRIATDADVIHHKENKAREEEAFRVCREKIAKHDLPMKLIQAQFSFDNTKLLFYFASESRVDFRELVKDLASVFKTRIELRQIGIRDEAKLFGGLGSCGRPLCCSTFLSDFAQVSIKMAKDQNLSLNSGKISGCCGRLMCCLQYEHKTYVEETAKTPPVDSTVKTRDGVGFVTEINALSGTVKVKLKDKPDVAPAWYKRDDVTVLSRQRTDDQSKADKNEKNENKNGD